MVLFFGNKTNPRNIFINLMFLKACDHLGKERLNYFFVKHD